LDATGLEHHLHHQAGMASEFFWHRLRWRAVQDHLPARGDLRLLDVGAGAGVLGDLVARDRPQVSYLFDQPIPSLSAQLEGRFGAAANRREEPRWDDVDVVTLLDVIEHLDDPEALLRHVCARCRPGTVLVMTVPGSERLWSQWDVTLGHRRRYSRRSLGELLGHLPVDVIEVSWLFPELLPAALWRTRRHPARPATGDEAPAAEFPVLPRWANDFLYHAGLVPLRLRRWMPAGTSLIAAARVHR
jgi:SAM-dependent methyltransferase